jgi:thiol:disulfide interchange protein DsbD
MNKKYFSFLLLLFLTTATWLNAQVLDPVKWTFSINPLKDNQYELIFKATIDDTCIVFHKQKLRGRPERDGTRSTSFHF